KIPGLLDKYTNTWIDIRGLANHQLIQQIAELLGLHKLAIEDVYNKLQRPKAEGFDSHVYCIARTTYPEIYPGTEQLNIFFAKNFIVTLIEFGGDEMEAVKDRIRSRSGKIWELGGDYIAYAIYDAVVDSYYPILDQFSDVLEDLEEQVIVDPDTKIIRRLNELKRELMNIKRAIWPLRETINRLIRNDYGIVSEHTMVFLRDLYDHIIHLVDVIEYCHDIISNLMNIYLSVISNRTNSVMKVLTIIATIFIPLTFIAGVYGMNFNPEISKWNMPELNWPFAYPVFWFVMIGVTAGLLLYFKKIGWLDGDR
ncbi:MAG TPA: magnesium/cobalt transporter CorA, partial [bacterium]